MHRTSKPAAKDIIKTQVLQHRIFTRVSVSSDNLHRNPWKSWGEGSGGGRRSWCWREDQRLQDCSWWNFFTEVQSCRVTGWALWWATCLCFLSRTDEACEFHVWLLWWFWIENKENIPFGFSWPDSSTSAWEMDPCWRRGQQRARQDTSTAVPAASKSGGLHVEYTATKSQSNRYREYNSICVCVTLVPCSLCRRKKGAWAAAAVEEQMSLMLFYHLWSEGGRRETMYACNYKPGAWSRLYWSQQKGFHWRQQVLGWAPRASLRANSSLTVVSWSFTGWISALAQTPRSPSSPDG